MQVDYANLQQLRGKRQICNNLLLYESDVMQGGGLQCQSHWFFQIMMAQVWQQGTKIFQYCTRPARRVTYNFHSSCKHMNSSLKIVCNKENGGGGI